MTRGSLGFVAAVLTGLMVIVATAGLDDLPRSLRESVTSAPSQLQADRSRFVENRKSLEQTLASDPALFSDKTATVEAKLEQDRLRLDQAAAAMVTLQQLAKENRRTDAEKVSRALREFETLRSEPVRDSDSLRAEAERAVYDKAHPFDKDAATAPARKAMVDWPEKRADLQSRLDSVHDSATADSLNALAGQLYVSWDRMLVKVDGSRQRVRMVRTRDGNTTSEERSEARQPGVGPELAGMVIEHKPAGKYDTEAERSAQQPGYAYMAPPGQSNRYGHWTGDVWHWLPAYMILSTILHGSRGPVTTRDYQGWHDSYRRGIPPPVVSGPAPRGSYVPPPTWKSPGAKESSSGWWKERPKDWKTNPGSGSGVGSGSGSFGSSQYRSRGSFSGSRYQSRGTFRSFGKGRR